MKISNLLVLAVILSLFCVSYSFGPCGSYTCGGDSDSKDLDDPKCKNWDYLYDQNQNSMGKSKCKTDCQCDGRRRCVDGCCTGWPRYAKDIGESNDNCLTPTYQADQQIKQNKCSSACDCGGNRFCSNSGYCHGTATYGDLCVNQGTAVTKTQAADVVKKDSGSSCNCQSLMGKAFDYIIADYIGDKNEDACTAFVNALQGKAIDATCAGSSFCSFCLGTITDAAAQAIPFQSPFVNVCLAMLNILQDFTGVNINTLRNQGRDKLESAFQNAAGAACGTIICSGNCQTKSLNGVSFATVAVETTCAVINTIGSINDITPSGLNSQIFTLWGLLLSALLFIIY